MKYDTVTATRKDTASLASVLLIALLAACSPVWLEAAWEPGDSPSVAPGADGRLAYTTDARGDRLPDFSYCGYRAAEQAIPDVPVRVVVPAEPGDATARIQQALAAVGARAPDAHGMRGAVLLEPGLYRVSGSLRMRDSGVVLRGSGMGPQGTTVLATGQQRDTLFTVGGRDDRVPGPPMRIADDYVPVNARSLRMETNHALQPGDHVQVHRPSTEAWIQALGTEHFGGGLTHLGWKPGRRDIHWDRTVVSVDGDRITLDAPLTTALDAAYGGGTVRVLRWPGRIERVGIENLRCRSTYDPENTRDENHRWMAVTMQHVRDAWVRQVVFEHFAGSAVAVLETARRVTVEDCKSLTPVSEIGNQRRMTFWTRGQQTLFQRLYAQNGYHDFAAGSCAAGPNAFVQCESDQPHSFSGGIDSWAAGVLFDIVHVDGQALSLMNLGQDKQGAGWNAANSVLWQCSAARIDCYRPPTAHNWAFGSWAAFAGDGYWEESNSHVRPRSLYYAQLQDRLGDAVPLRAHLLPVDTRATSSPSVELAAALAAQAQAAPRGLSDWIDQAGVRQPIPLDRTGARIQETVTRAAPSGAAASAARLSVRNGWLVHGDRLLTGRRLGVRWWSGGVRPHDLARATPHVTRFVPGRSGTGLTDDLVDVTDRMQAQHQVALEHNYGLWYERRRDDHERVRRMNGDVWPPFYELPFARTGQGTAFDGLSRYDLTRYNPWYWGRLAEFARLAEQKGLVLIQQHYFQHNILEAGAHWTDFPWRPANNINHTGFPEPPPYAGDKRIFMAEPFYDVNHPVRGPLHRAFIRQCLDNVAHSRSVLHLVGAEFTGPLHFVRFWIDTMRTWEGERGQHALVGLSVTRDVQDAILADPVRGACVDVVDIRYWHYRGDGSLYAPAGGQHLAPRQHARLVKPGRTTFAQVVRALREYRGRCPEKALLYSADLNPDLAWAVLMGGGSLPGLPRIEAPGFLQAAVSMSLLDLPGAPADQWALGNADGEAIVYSLSSRVPALTVAPGAGPVTLTWIDPEHGTVLRTQTVAPGASVQEWQAPGSGPVVLWLTRS